jgi:thymidylate synthase
MQQIKDLVSRILLEGEPRQWRNGHTGLSIFSHQMEFDLRDGFPACTTKALPLKSVFAELVGFLRGVTNAEDFRNLGTKIWDQNANEEQAWLANPQRKGTDDLGRIYGAQWRDWRDVRIIHSDELYKAGPQGWSAAWSAYGEKGFRHEFHEELGGQMCISRNVDQIAELINGLENDPHGRRHIVSAWNPAELDTMALPPCHMMFQCFVGGKQSEDDRPRYLDLKMYQRSADAFLGVPFNVASYAALTHLLAHLTGLKARRLIIDLADAHLYTNQIEPAREWLTRIPGPLPTLSLDTLDPQYVVDAVEVEHFVVTGYDPLPSIKVGMAV